jgi:hypothetical protein
MLEEAKLTDLEIYKLVYGYIGVEGGYLGDFSYNSHRQFYIDLSLDIIPDVYSGTTKDRFITILNEQPAAVQARILEGILQRYPPESSPKRTARAPEIRGWILRLRGAGMVESPIPQDVSSVVEVALAEASALIGAGKRVSAVDRIHTALHGYLRDMCDKAGISRAPDDSITKLYKNLREQHPALKGLGPYTDRILRILATFSSVLDTLNTLRNAASLAHPNEELLDEAEAELAINAALTIFNYLEKRLHQPASGARA